MASVYPTVKRKPEPLKPEVIDMFAGVQSPAFVSPRPKLFRSSSMRCTPKETADDKNIPKMRFGGGL